MLRQSHILVQPCQQHKILLLYFSYFCFYSLCLPFKHAGTGEFGVVIVQITQQVGSLSKGAKTKNLR